MTDTQTTENADTTAETAPVVTTTFAEIVASIEPPTVREMILKTLDETLELINSSNARVARIQESRKNDPTSTEYQDAVWRRVAAENSDAEVVKIEARYQKLVAQSEELLSKLREMAKGHMQPALSDEELANERKVYNEGKAAIEESTAKAATLAEMADAMLSLTGTAIEGGVMSLMPKTESLLNTRGRKSGKTGTRAEGGYATRIGSATIDGVDAAKGEGDNRKYSFAILADKLSERFNAKAFAQNAVTTAELEEALYNSAGVAFRDKDKLPESLEFEFTKEIAVQNTNDDSTRNEPHTVKIGWVKWVAPNANPTTTENAPAENAQQPTE